MEANNSKPDESDKANREISVVENKQDDVNHSVGKLESFENDTNKIGVNSDCSAESSTKSAMPSIQTNQFSQDNDTSEKPQDDKIEEDDVPGDFFDDFLKEDFMAGLDIVDEDEWDEEKEKQGTKNFSESSKMKRKQSTKDQKVQKKRNHEKGDDLRKRLREKRNDNDLRKKLKEREDARKPRKNETIDADEFDIRRDPDKTRRDIERDKIKCEKDKEQKIITEKLKLVETGLVPPGMEMETDLEDIQKQKALESKRSSEVKTSKSEKSFSKNSPRKRIARSPRRHSPHRKVSPSRRSPRKVSRSPNRRSPLKRRSPLRHSPYKHSPVRRRTREHSLRRSLDRNLRRSHDTDPRRSIDRDIRRSLERSRKSRSRSPVYRVNKYKYFSRHKRSRSRSRSPKRRRESEKKKSFLQEIAEKLNETRPNNMFPYQSMPTYPSDIYHIAPQPQVLPPAPVPAPAPVPPPISTQYPSQHEYDKHFFIGTPQNVANTTIGLPIQLPNYQSNLQSGQTQENTKVKDDFAKLFQDKKITLTEFLAITAKPEVYSASPDHMKEKIKVISRCQEAIKFLGLSEKKFTGPLVIQKGQKQKQSFEKFVSPILKSSQLKLPFTEIPNSEEQRKDFTIHLNSLLDNLGLPNNDVIVIEDANPVSCKMSAAPPPPSISTRNLLQVETRPPIKQTTPLKKSWSKLVQTEEYKCIDCDKRKKIFYKNVGTQCGNDGISFSIGTQVKEDDFFPKLLKTQSLASLTPAQLLGKTSVSKPADFDSFSMKNAYRPPGYSYGSEGFLPNQFNPPRYVPQPPGQLFEPPNAAGMRGPRERDNRFNNYY